jgi:hypothetical protein
MSEYKQKEVLSLSQQCELGVAVEQAIYGRAVNLAQSDDSEAKKSKANNEASTDALKDVSGAFANEPVEQFVERVARVPNLHAAWALGHLNSGGKARTAADFDALWTTKKARAAFGSLVRADQQRRDGALQIDDVELRNVAVRALWLLVGSTQVGKSTLLACMRAIANRDFAGVANGGVAATLQSGTKDTPNTAQSALLDLTTALNVIDAGDSRGLVDAQLLERVIASIAVASGIAAYGYDSEDKHTAADAVKRKASVVVVCVNASQCAPLWMRALRVANDGTISIDETVNADANVRLDDPTAWTGLVALRDALGRLGIQVFVVLTHVDCLRGTAAEKCAEFKSIFRACPLSIEMKDFVVLPARDSAHGADMSAYTYKKVACIMLRLVRATLQHTDFVAAVECAKPEAQPSAAQRAVGRLRGGPVVAPLSIDELVKKKLSKVTLPPPAQAAGAVPVAASPQGHAGLSPVLSGLLLLIAAIIGVAAILMAMQVSALKESVVHVSNRFDTISAQMAAAVVPP